MYKLRKIYICNHCGKIALPELYGVGEDLYKAMPPGWGAITRHEHLCPRCFGAYEQIRWKEPRDDD